MNTLKKLEIAIIGNGKVGQSLAQLLRLTDFNITIVGRNVEKQRAVCASADVVLLCVNDGAIESVCESVAESLKAGSVVSHCSAALDSSILSAAKNAGCLVASTHPLNTFPSVELALATFSNTNHNSYLYAEGDSEALALLLPLFDKLGFVTNTIERAAKPMYHVACVFACNYLTSLMELSMQSAEAAGLERDDFWQAIQAIINATIENIDKNGAAKSLSGPIARGDSSTIASHLSTLKSAPPALEVSYADLGLHALALALENKQLDETKADEIKQMLDAASARHD